MYYDGSIASRLRELQNEADAAYARVNYVHELLKDAYAHIKNLEDQNQELFIQLRKVQNSKEESTYESGRAKKIKRNTE